MNKIKIYLIAALATCGIAMTSCDDDDNKDVAKAVLASTQNLNFDATDNDQQMITVYSDATWTCDHPDWVLVTPETGSGTTDVVITVSDNLRDGTPDNPRKADVVFHGTTKASEAHITVRQAGDKYRGVEPISISEFDACADETYVVLKDLTVVEVYKDAYMATDGTDNILLQGDVEMINGNTYTVYGERATDGKKLSVLLIDNIVEGGTASSLGLPLDVTENLDTYTSNTRSYISITGKLDGNNIVVKDANLHGVILDGGSLKETLGNLNGHNITLYCFYAGTASPAFNVYAGGLVTDLGLVETVYWMEDFEWLEPWAVGGGAGETVASNNLDAAAPALTSVKTTIDGKEMTCFDYIESLGYKFIYDKNDNKRTYLQRNYLKFGKTGNHSGIILPSIETVPADANVELVFDWCPMRQGSGKLDPVNLYVIIDNGQPEEIEIPTHGWANDHKLEWIKAVVDLKGYKIDKYTKITITQREWEVGTANRWFLDNIKIRLKEE